MQLHNADNTSLHIHYSPTARHSLGLRMVHLRRNDFRGAVAQANFLIRRINKIGSQANFYIKLGAGGGRYEDRYFPAVFGGAAVDWETRRLFARYESRGWTLGDAGKFFTHSARAGIAPYVAEYGALHTWLMVDATQRFEGGEDKDIDITPVVRFFKGKSLVEVGYSFSEKLTLNFIRRF